MRKPPVLAARPARQPARPLFGLSLITLVLWLVTCLLKLRTGEHLELGCQTGGRPHAGVRECVSAISSVDVDAARQLSQHFIDGPVQSPYKNQFSELGSRLHYLQEWIQLAEGTSNRVQREALSETTERLVKSMFPFLRSAKQTASPLQDLRQSFTKPRGIVIPTGNTTLRYACHLVSSLRQVLRTKLPIQIVYAGEQDLPTWGRQAIASLSRDDPIEFLYILEVFDDSTLQLASGGWAIKAFAALAAPFREVVVLDADAVFLQSPEVLFEQEGYLDAGSLFFHDRLLWQNQFPERHEWWHSQVTNPSPQLAKSLVWTQRYAEEQDSGVIVLDKSRLDVLMGLLHVAWQNTRDVREEVTFRLTYGDKESWWLGFELAGARYAFERHYGGIIGWKKSRQGTGTSLVEGGKLCSFVIAHVDDRERLLWYNGGLLKNKMLLPTTFEVPTHWAIDGKWEKGARKEDMSCMVGGERSALTKGEANVLEQTMALAQQIDSSLNLV